MTKPLDGLLDQIFATTPLPFVQGFLREHKKEAKTIRIGADRNEARTNLRDAVLAALISLEDLQTWFASVEGWGRQHLYLARVPRRSLALNQLLTTAKLRTFLKNRGALADDANIEPTALALTDVAVDDELARVNWRAHAIQRERREEYDKPPEEHDDGIYEFQAYRLIPRRSTARLIIRKTDGLVLKLIHLPEGEDHDVVSAQMDGVASAVLAPLFIKTIPIGPISSALDQAALGGYGPKPKRAQAIGVSPTQARFRAPGAQLEFKSTTRTTGYTDSTPVRDVRQAMQVAKFEGDGGKFRLNFVGAGRRPHDMLISLNAQRNRVYLFSTMNETEVLDLVDRLVAMEPKS